MQFKGLISNYGNDLRLIAACKIYLRFFLHKIFFFATEPQVEEGSTERRLSQQVGRGDLVR